LKAKTDYDIAMMRKAGEITKNALNFAKNLIKPGISTMFLDKQIKMFIIDSGAKPSFLNYNGFPGSACI